MNSLRRRARNCESGPWKTGGGASCGISWMRSRVYESLSGISCLANQKTQFYRHFPYGSLNRIILAQYGYFKPRCESAYFSCASRAYFSPSMATSSLIFPRSRWMRKWPKSPDEAQDLGEQPSQYCDLGELEGHVSPVANNLRGGRLAAPAAQTAVVSSMAPGLCPRRWPSRESEKQQTK